MNIGVWGEAQATAYLKKKGYSMAERNYRKRTGEIDIIAFDGEILCFIEVKTRSGLEYGWPYEAVNWKKHSNLRKTATQYIMEHKLQNSSCRFDVIEIIRTHEQSYIRHLEDVFEY